MSVQDELLSFQIKETIFLSSDKANIGEMKELEIVPDVEIIENNNEITITGCLQLHGRYEPARNAQATQAGGTDSLLEAMKFTPFQLQDEAAGHFLQGGDAELVHRIPLNVSIPLSRIEELSDIYAIIDSFDYEIKTPHQLQIQADLKIAGIHLKNQAAPRQVEFTPAANEQESWQFVHLANTPEEVIQPTSIEEIERKLAELEREVESREQRYQAQEQAPAPFGSSPFVAAPYPASAYPPQPYASAPYASAPYTPAPFMSEQAKAYQAPPQSQPYNPWAYQGMQPSGFEPQPAAPVESFTEVQRTANLYTESEEPLEAVQTESYTELELTPEGELEANPEHIRVSIKEQDKIIDFQSAYDVRQVASDYQESALEADIAAETESADTVSAHVDLEELAEEIHANEAEVAENQVVETQAAEAQVEEVQVEEAQVADTQAAEAQVAEAQVEEAQVEEAQIEEAQVEEIQVDEAQVEETQIEEVQTEAEAKEMRVAIGSKPTKEKDESLSITSLFSNAGRPKTEQAVEGRATESTASASRESNEAVRSSTANSKSGLTSFVRDTDQQFSRLKMCIIQGEETIQMVADRYALPVSRLVEVNRLSSDRVTKGQVLYIPQ